MRCPRPLLLGLVAASLIPAIAAPAGAATEVALDGPAFSFQRSGDDVLVSGLFTHVGRSTGAAMLLDGATRALDARYPRIDGQVSAAVADGSGGVYAGGEFVRVGALDRAHLVHLRADGSVDAAFDPSHAVKGFVGALVRHDGVLYVGGKPAGRNGPAGVTAVLARSGTAVPGFNPPSLPYARELALQGDRLYVGSDAGLVALDASTGALDRAFTPGATGSIHALLATPQRLYVGTSKLQARDLATGAVLPGFSPTSLSGPGHVETLLMDRGHLLEGGSFGPDGTEGGFVSAADPVTGIAATAFDAPVGNAVYALATTSQGLWAAGRPHGTRGNPQTRVALLDRSSGRVRGSSPGFDAAVYTLAATGSGVFTGGAFTASGTQTRRGLAAFDVRSGKLDPGFVPDDATESDPFAATAGGRLYGWTGFGPAEASDPGSADDNCGDLSSDRLVARSERTGRTLASFRRRTIVAPIAITATPGAIYDVRQVGKRPCSGPFHAFGPNVLEIRDPRTGALRVSRRLPFKGYVSDIVATSSRIYVSGSFRRFARYAGVSYPEHLAVMALDARTGRIDAHFDTHAHGPVYGLALGADGSLYLSGLFDTVQGASRPGLAKVFGALGGLERRFAPSVKANANVALDISQPGALELRASYAKTRRVDPRTGRALNSPGPGSYADTTITVNGRLVSYASPYRFNAGGGEDQHDLLRFGTP